MPYACCIFNRAELSPDFSLDIESFDIHSLSRLRSFVGNGREVSASDFPKRAISGRKNPKRLRHVIDLGVIAFSENVIELLRGFDLGDCQFHPVQLLDKNGKTELEHRYAYVEYRNVKESFQIDQTPRARSVPSHRNPKMKDYRYPPIVPKDDEIVLSSAALDGPDIWVEKYLFYMVFVSDRLADALKSKRLSPPFFLRRCRIV